MALNELEVEAAAWYIASFGARKLTHDDVVDEINVIYEQYKDSKYSSVGTAGFDIIFSDDGYDTIVVTPSLWFDSVIRKGT